MQSTDMTEINCSFNVLEIKCQKCGLVCSVSPVSEESGSFYCGRCRPDGAPNLRFEEAAEKVLFPCAFGCGNFNAGGEQTLNHEVHCRNRTVVCPFGNCTSTSNLQDLSKHIEACHRVYDKETPRFYFSSQTLGIMYYMTCITFDKFVFLFFIKLYRGAGLVGFQYNVCLVWPQNCNRQEFYNMQLRLKIDVPKSDLTITKLIQCRNIDDYNDRSHCANCLFQRCNKIRHENKFNLPFHNDILVNVKDGSRVDLHYTVKVHKNETVSGKVLNSLECPVCMDYMTDKIYFCERGHSLCDKCKGEQSGQKCPVCRGHMLNIRNFSMEKLAKQLNDINVP